MTNSYNTDTQSPNNNKLKSNYWMVSFILFIVVFAIAAYYFSRIKKEFILLEKENISWLLLAFLGQFITYLCSALIYYLLLKGFKADRICTIIALIKASIISLFFNQTMPSAGISGNTYFFRFLSRFNISTNTILSLIITELIIFYTGMEIIILSLLIFCLAYFHASRTINFTLIAGFFIYLMFAILITLAGKKNIISRLIEKLKKGKIGRQLVHNITRQQLSGQNLMLSSFVKNNKKITASALLLQLALVIADALTIYALFYGLGVSVSIFSVLLSLICTKIISILPFLPGSLILYESSMTFFFISLGITLETAAIVTLVYRFLSFWIPIPLGLFLYRKWVKDLLTDKAKDRSDFQKT